MLDERPDEFEHRNLFLHALLGMISAGQRLGAAIEPGDPSADPAPLEDPWLLCVLGVVAFHSRLKDHLAQVEAPLAPPAPVPAARPPLRDLLR